MLQRPIILLQYRSIDLALNATSGFELVRSSMPLSGDCFSLRHRLKCIDFVIRNKPFKIASSAFIIIVVVFTYVVFILFPLFLVALLAMISLVSGCSTAVMLVFVHQESSPFYSVTFSNLEVLNVKTFVGDLSHLSDKIYIPEG